MTRRIFSTSELHPAVEQVGPSLNLDEIAAVELFAKARRFVEDAAPDDARPVLKRKGDEQIPAAPVPDILVGAEEKPPPVQLRRQHADMSEIASKTCALIISNPARAAIRVTIEAPMLKRLVAIVAFCSALALGACSEQPAGRRTADADATARPEACGACRRGRPAEPDYPQPAVVIPPRPKPGAPHGPGFDMPLIDVEGYMPARPMDVLRDAHMFTADHPEVASYVPCYCGCGSAGHKNNADCFVKGRDAEGRVTEWEPHGVSCAVCIDIAVDSMKMRNSGASVTAIRKKVQSDYRAAVPDQRNADAGPPQGK